MATTESPIVFLRIGWMTRYDGLGRNDEIRGGGKFVAERGYGHEIFNFRRSGGMVYGFVQTPGARFNDPLGPGINIQRIAHPAAMTRSLASSLCGSRRRLAEGPRSLDGTKTRLSIADGSPCLSDPSAPTRTRSSATTLRRPSKMRPCSRLTSALSACHRGAAGWVKRTSGTLTTVS